MLSKGNVLALEEDLRYSCSAGGAGMADCTVSSVRAHSAAQKAAEC